MVAKIVVENHQESGKTWPQYLAVLSALFAIFNSGIHFGWPSPSVPKILSEEYVFNVTVEEASYITIIGPVGDLFGSIIYPAIVDRIGRKNTILLIAVPQILSMTMIYLSFYSKILLYAARFTGGLAEAACFTIIPLYIGEVCEPRIRGRLGSLFSTVLTVGMLAVNVVGSYLNMHTAALIFATLPVLFLIIFSQMPESPSYLIMKSKVVEAEDCLRKLRRKENVDDELKILMNDVNRQMSEPGRYRDLYTIKSNRLACVVMFTLRIIQQFSGVSAFALYMQVLFDKSTTILPKETASITICIIQLISNLTGVLVVDRTGRKPLLVLSCIGCSLTLFFEAIYFTLQDYTVVEVSNFDYLPLVGIVVFTVTFTVGLGNVVNLMIGEMFSSSIKAKASCLMNVIFAITMTFGTKFFQYTSDTISMCVPFYVYGICQVLGAVFCVVYVPETKGKTLEEIQLKLKEK
ncbi:hypothetical protein NQ317_005082 [Molorchus minor]|uniref:Major facilitator superfamily (MFS) profile domain-containing protein n=1 Tax=Molorchus minor TaxID=1323400 RepID=A0ABQ9JZD4_9CUCU|nr:hypothetical protein NQ317_005082 [Molorchus minor]